MYDNNTQQQTLGHQLYVNFANEYGMDMGGLTDDFFSTYSMNLLDREKVSEFIFFE